MLNWIKLVEHQKNQSLVNINSQEPGGNEKYTGYISNVSRVFVSIRTVECWHYDGLTILPIELILDCETSEINDDRSSIIQWNNSQEMADFSWIDINSYEMLFSSIKKKEKFIYISDGLAGEVGKIVDVSSDKVTMQGIDGSGKEISEPFEFTFFEVAQITIDDEYSKVLQAFYEK